MNWALGSEDEIPATPQAELLERAAEKGGDGVAYDAELQAALLEHGPPMLAAGEPLLIECGGDAARYNTALHFYMGLHQGIPHGPMLRYDWDGQTFTIYPPT